MSVQIINTSVKRRNEKTKIKFITNYELLEKVRNRPVPQSFKMSSFPTLTKNLGGLCPGEVVVLTGPGGTGKSLFCQTLTNDFCYDGHIPLWFEYEMPDWMFLDRFKRKAEDLHFMVPEELTPCSIVWLCDAIEQSKETHETEIVFIDHLHYVFDMGKISNVSYDIGQIMRRLKTLAIKLEIVIFIVCHIDKCRIESLDDIGMHRIRDSSFISQESDIVLFVWNNVTEDGLNISNKQIVKICKSRRTGIMFKSIPLVKNGEYLAELAEENKVKYTGGGIYSPRETF